MHAPCYCNICWQHNSANNVDIKPAAPCLPNQQQQKCEPGHIYPAPQPQLPPWQVQQISTPECAPANYHLAVVRPPDALPPGHVLATPAGAAADISGGATRQRRQRRAAVRVPDEQKTESYWRRRMRNNLSARRSREKRRQCERGLIQTFGCLCEDVYKDLLIQAVLVQARCHLLGGRPPGPDEDPSLVFNDSVCYGLKEALRAKGFGTSVCLPWRNGFHDLAVYDDKRFIECVNSGIPPASPAALDFPAAPDFALPQASAPEPVDSAYSSQRSNFVFSADTESLACRDL